MSLTARRGGGWKKRRAALGSWGISSGRHAETTGYREYLAGGNLCYYFLEFPKAYTAGLCVCPSSLL